MDQIKLKEKELQKKPSDNKIVYQIKLLQQISMITVKEIEMKLKYAKQTF